MGVNLLQEDGLKFRLFLLSFRVLVNHTENKKLELEGLKTRKRETEVDHLNGTGVKKDMEVLDLQIEMI